MDEINQSAQKDEAKTDNKVRISFTPLQLILFLIVFSVAQNAVGSFVDGFSDGWRKTTQSPTP